jgi:hypothetical protein
MPSANLALMLSGGISSIRARNAPVVCTGTCQPCQLRAGDVHFLQRQRHQPGGHVLARG